MTVIFTFMKGKATDSVGRNNVHAMVTKPLETQGRDFGHSWNYH